VRFLVAALGAAFFAMGEAVAKPLEDVGLGDKAEWYSCKKDKDCVPEESIYGGVIGVNKQYHKNYQAWLNEIKYERVGALPKNLEAVCIEDLCTQK